LYTDLSLFTARYEYGEDATNVFNMLTGYCEPPAFHKLIVAPMNLRKWTLQKIANEERAGPAGRIFAQMNALVDAKVIEALYRASQAGVQIDLIVRGICCLKAGLPGVSENIRVYSIVDRFLEHRRIFNFQADGANEVYLGSADWMERNLNRRVEVLFPIEDPLLKTRILDEIIKTAMSDNVKIRAVREDGQHHRIEAIGEPLRSQKRFIELARGSKQPKQPEAQLPEPRMSPFVQAASNAAVPATAGGTAAPKPAVSP
jgi:polyphosphate kinase